MRSSGTACARSPTRSPGELRLESRNLNDITDSYPELRRLNRALSSHGAVLDGEIVAFDEDGRPSFGALQQRMHVAARAQAARLAKSTPVTYMIFDLLWLDGHSLMGLPYSERRERLAALQLTGEQLADARARRRAGAGAARGHRARRASRASSPSALTRPTEPGQRTRDWVKVKNVGRQEFVIGGWMPGKGRRAERIGALLLGVHEPDGALRYVGRVGSGFSDPELERLARLLVPLAPGASPFTRRPASPARGDLLRAATRRRGRVHASGPGPAACASPPTRACARTSAPRRSCARTARRRRSTRQRAPRARAPCASACPGAPGRRRACRCDGRELKLSNLDKVLYPRTGFTKRGADRLLRRDRAGPARAPGRARADRQALARRRAAASPSFRSRRQRTHRRGCEPRPCPASASRSTTCSSRTWRRSCGSRTSRRSNCTRRSRAPRRSSARRRSCSTSTPASRRRFVECCRVGLLLQGMFENLGLQSFAKTSGSKGLQLYVPLNTADDHLRADQAVRQGRRRAARGDRTRAGRLAHDQGAAHGQGADRLEPERPPQDDRVRLLAARRRAPDGVHAGRAGRRCAPRSTPAIPPGCRFEAPRVLERVAERGDLFAPVLSLVQQLPALDR